MADVQQLDTVVRIELDRARQSGNGRSATTVVGGHEKSLRQTVIALIAGAELAEHDSPGEATLYVLCGHVSLVAGSDTWEGHRGDLLEIPPMRHSLHAHEDSAALLTVAKTS